MATNQTAGPLVDKSIYLPLTRWFLVPANIIVSLLGISTNIINLIVFSKMTNKDTMTISLTALAFSDFILACFNLAANVINSFLFNGVPVLFKIDLESLIVTGFSWSRPAFHKISTMITTFVSFERALCVIKPFLVKRIFTKQRSLVIIVCSYITFIAAFVPVHVAGRLTWQYPVDDNSSGAILKASFASERYAIEGALVLSVGLTFVWVSQALILINALVMSVGLRRSRKFREGVGHSSDKNLRDKKENTPNLRDKKTTLKTGNKTASSPTAATNLANSGFSSKSKGSSLKEDRLIKTVLILAVIHISLNSPLSVYYISLPFVPEYGAYKRYHNLFMLTIDSVNILETLNGVFNIFVYLTLNTKFKMIFGSMFMAPKCISVSE